MLDIYKTADSSLHRMKLTHSVHLHEIASVENQDTFGIVINLSMLPGIGIHPSPFLVLLRRQIVREMLTHLTGKKFDERVMVSFD